MRDERPIDTWLDVLAKVETEGGAWATTVRALKETATQTRRGRRMSDKLAAEISDNLKGLGIGHVPDKIPHDATQRVLLFLQDSPGGKLVEMGRSVRRGEEVSVRSLGEALARANEAWRRHRADRGDAP